MQGGLKPGALTWTTMPLLHAGSALHLFRPLGASPFIPPGACCNLAAAERAMRIPPEEVLAVYEVASFSHVLKGGGRLGHTDQNPPRIVLQACLVPSRSSLLYKAGSSVSFGRFPEHCLVCIQLLDERNLRFCTRTDGYCGLGRHHQSSSRSKRLYLSAQIDGIIYKVVTGGTTHLAQCPGCQATGQACLARR